MHSRIKTALITLICAGWLVLTGCHHGAVDSDRNKPAQTGPMAGTSVPGRHDAGTPSMGQIAEERARALLAEVEAETPEESVRNLLYKTVFVVSEIRSVPPGPDDLITDANRNPRVQKLLRITREGTDAQRQALRDAILRMIHVYLTELPESSPERVAWQPSVRHPGGGVTYFYLLSHLDVDPPGTLKLLVDVHLREQAACRHYHYPESKRPPGQQDRPQSIVLTEHGQFLAMAADQLLATIRSRTGLQKGLTQPQLDVLHRFERQRQTVASEGDDELRILKDATEFVYPGGVPDSPRPTTRPGSQPARQPTEVPASRNADEQITKAYNAGESADKLAEALNKTVPSLFYGEEVIIRSSPDAKQIIVTGSARVHAMLGSLPPPISQPRWDKQHVVHVFDLKNRKAEACVEVVQGALDGEDATVIPDTQANRLIVYIAKKDLNRIAYLIAVLDRPRLSKPSEDRLARVVRLKHARPADFIDVITRLYPMPASMPDYAPPREVLAQMVTTSSPKGSEDIALISAAPRLEPEIKALIPLLDTARPAEIELSKVFALENADAEEVAVLLGSLWKELDPRFRAMADTRTNSLIVQASIACLEVVAEIVQALDKPEVWRGDPKEFMREFMQEFRDKHKTGSASHPATRPVQTPASHSADGQITKIYDVRQPADEIAHWLEEILTALAGGADAPVIISSVATRQIIVAGSPGAHKLVEEFLPKLEREPVRPKRPPASRPATGLIADLPPWGEEVEGLRCRLVPDRSTLKQGELPQVILYVRDQASRVLTSYFDTRGDSPWVSCELEVDGQWHSVQLHGLDESDGAKVLVSLGNGPPRLGFPMRLWHATDGKQSPALAPGIHTLRAAFTVSVSAGRGVRPIRVLSKPVEIEILPAGSNNTASQPASRLTDDQPATFVFALVNTKADQVGWSLREGLKAWPDGMQISFDTRTNTIIIRASEHDRPRLAYLVAQIDKPESVETDDDAQRITKGFELKHAEATAVADAIARLYPPSRAMNSWDTVTVRPDSEPEAVIIKCVSARVAEIGALISLLDTANLADVQIIRLFHLGQADAEDLAAPLADLAEQVGIRCRIGPDLAANALIVQADAAALGIVGRLLKHFDRPGWPVNESRLRGQADASQRKEERPHNKIDLLRGRVTEQVIADAQSADLSTASRALDTLAVRLCMDSLSAEQCTAVAEAALKGLTRAPSRSATDHMCVTLLDDLRLDNRLTDEQQVQFFDSLITAEIKTRPQSVLSIGIPARLTLSTRGRGTRLWFVIDSTGGLGVPGGPLSGGGLGCSGPAGHAAGMCGAVLKPRGLGPETIHATLNAKIYDWSFTGLLINDRPVLPSQPLHAISRDITARTTVVEKEPSDYLKMTSDPALEGQITSAISVRKVSQRQWGLEADIVARESPVDLAVTVVAVAGDRRTEPVTLCIRRNVDDNYPTGLGRLLDVTHVDIVLTPDPKLARESVDLTEIWGKPIRFEHVPVVDEGEILGPQPELSSPSSGSDDVPLSEMEPLPIMERERLKDAMARWEQYQYTPIVVDRIPEMVRGIKVRSYAELSRQQHDALVETLGLFLRIAGKPDADALRQLRGITGAPDEYDLGDPAIQKHHDCALNRLRAVKGPEDQIPAGYADRQIKFAETLWKTNGGPPIATVAVSESRIIIGRIKREAFSPLQWDPCEGGDSELIGRYVALGQSPVSLRGWLATKATRDKLMTPRNVLYADLRMPFKTEPDPANYGVFRFVWLEDPEKWVPVHSVWFYGGPQKRFYPCW